MFCNTTEKALENKHVWNQATMDSADVSLWYLA